MAIRSKHYFIIIILAMQTQKVHIYLLMYDLHIIHMMHMIQCFILIALMVQQYVAKYVSFLSRAGHLHGYWLPSADMLCLLLF